MPRKKMVTCDFVEEIKKTEFQIAAKAVSKIPYILSPCNVSPFSTLPAAIQKEFPGWFYRESDLLWN